jgi:hypothetical protein
MKSGEYPGLKALSLQRPFQGPEGPCSLRNEGAPSSGMLSLNCVIYAWQFRGAMLSLYTAAKALLPSDCLEQGIFPCSLAPDFSKPQFLRERIFEQRGERPWLTSYSPANPSIS